MKTKVTKRKLAELVFDYDLYPRSEIDSQHVGYLVEAIKSGATLPALVIDAKSKKIADGFHRAKAYLRLNKPDFAVECIEKTYRNDGELLADAMRYNAGHGRRLTTHDRAHCLILGDRLGLTPVQIAAALNMTPDAIGKLRADRMGELQAVGAARPEPVALKRTIRHMVGETLTAEQSKANDRLSGMQQQFYVNQVITILENDLLEPDNPELRERLLLLARLIDTKLGATA